MELNSRELATVILVSTLVIIGLVVPGVRKALLPSVTSVIKAFFAPSILRAVASYLIYCAILVMLGVRLDLWNPGLLKDTLIIVLFVGFPIIMNSFKVANGEVLLRQVAKEAAGISAFLAFYVNLETLTLWAEILLQIALTLFTLLGLAGQREPRTRQVGQFFLGLNAVAGLVLLSFTTVQVILNWSTYDGPQLARTLALSLWLPISLFPFIYFLALGANYESILVRLSFFNNKSKPRLGNRIALVVGLRLSLRLTHEFKGMWNSKIAKADGFADGLRIMKQFRASLIADHEARVHGIALLREFEGVNGLDVEGRVLDRREFAETKAILNDLYYMQMGWYRSRSEGYRPDILEILGDTSSKGIRPPHEIHVAVRKDKQSWMAWRKTPIGHYFATGGTSNLSSEWQYDGIAPPDKFPGEKATGWINRTEQEASIEWRTKDRTLKDLGVTKI